MCVYCLLFIVLSCSKNNDDSSCDCGVEKSESVLHVGNKALKIMLYKEDLSSNYSFYSVNLNEIDDVYSFFDDEQKGLSGLILYTTKLSDDVVNKTDVNGLVTFVKKGDFFETNIYKKTDDSFVKMNQVDLKSYYISANDLRFEYIVF